MPSVGRYLKVKSKLSENAQLDTGGTFMIKARIPAANPDANLKSYTETYKRFNWNEVAKEFTWSQTGKVNIIHEAIDRWAQDPKKQNQIAFLFENGA